jgi:protein-tyrosine phosphatase
VIAVTIALIRPCARTDGSRPPHLRWDGSFNARDLGGLPTVDGRTTMRRRVVRADALDRLTSAGWQALLDHGVRTVIDLREPSERSPRVSPRPPEVATVELPLDVREDTEFWEVWANGPHFGTPLYFRPHITRQPARNAAVLRAIADAGPGAVLFHCQGGRDRTGQIAMLLLALVGVRTDAIAADYALSRERQRALWAARGEADQGVSIDAFLASRETTQEQMILDALAGLDVRAVLAEGGLEEEHVERLRARLLV